MFEAYESMFPKILESRPLKVWVMSGDPFALDEVKNLLCTLGHLCVGESIITVRKIVPRTYLGKGTLEQVAEQMCEKNIDAVVVDFELNPAQLRNVEQVLKKPVTDRAGLILEIFQKHAKTREAKLQIEIARLQYLLPRLAHYWSHFERQRGGIGLKGVGEKQIEIDRRLIRKRVGLLQKKFKKIARDRVLKRRRRKEVFEVALIGYTNAGKSTLLNQLTLSQVLVENKLFATLDTVVRALDPKVRPPIIASDTVGLIQRIPPTLIASFHSTLEELQEADLLLEVYDMSSSFVSRHIEVTQEVLKQLNLMEKSRLKILNKKDLLKGAEGQIQKKRAQMALPGACCVSAFSKRDVKILKKKILSFFEACLEVHEFFFPFEASEQMARLESIAMVEKKKVFQKGIFYRVKMVAYWMKRFHLEAFLLKQGS